ncbi:MAG: hypothetical protein ACRDQD_16395 [Nocardioidaceae bacterium]
MQGAEVNIGGIWLSSLGPWGDLVVEDRWPGGNHEITGSLDPKLTHRHPALTNGARAIVTVGGPRWAGELAQLDWEDGAFVATGLWRQGDEVPALNAAGLTTTVPNSAAAKAISAGWVDWILASGLSSSPYSSSDAGGDATAQVNALGALLDEWTAGSGKRWGVDELRDVYAAVDPTTATHLLINTPAPVESKQRAVSAVIARWRDAAGTYFTTIRGTGRPAKTVDFTNAGPLTSSQVTARCDRILSASAGASTYGAFIITRDQIIGRPHLSTVRAGQRVVIVDQIGADLNLLGPSLVLGGTKWNVAEETVECAPVDAPELDLESIIGAQGGELV